ncbi:hypothetical protein EX895_006568 [Sporisorium graminicola]|uniref:Pectin acetylesterase n=1 Tax=Sporisorium graminicola TaxID=280036 RepID=A0A4U7KLI3_9BASI|nr:hypothetical protein EX895_006568 [Sporisorium graminicola]TKY84666.1 hypothetical protein EX895_006568 [Sporisorium graminicola]
MRGLHEDNFTSASVRVLLTATASIFFSAACFLSFTGSFRRRTLVDHPREFVPPPAYDKWHWQEADGSVCANGSPTGFGYSIHPNATELVFYIEGGGGCWDHQGCFIKPIAAHLTGYNSTDFFSRTRGFLDDALLLSSRDPKRKNPWAKANYIFVPYCTADFHAGNNVVTYEGAPAPIHHKGLNNMQNMLRFASSAMPNVKDVWISGTSAGCYGATLNYIPTKKAFPQARVHLIGDSCEAPTGWLNTKPSWKLYQPSQSDCPHCVKDDFNSFLPGYSLGNPSSRFASVSFQSDTVLTGYMHTTFDALHKIIDGYFANITHTRTNQAKTFTVPGKDHCVLFKKDPVSVTNVTLSSFLTTMSDLDSTFSSV